MEDLCSVGKQALPIIMISTFCRIPLRKSCPLCRDFQIHFTGERVESQDLADANSGNMFIFPSTGDFKLDKNLGEQDGERGMLLDQSFVGAEKH